MSNDKKKEFKIKFQKEVKVKKDGKGDDETYVIRTKKGEEQSVVFEGEVKDGETESKEVELEYKKKGDDDSKYTEFKPKFKYKKSFFFEGIELPAKTKIGTTSYEVNEALKPSIGFFKSMNWPVYLTFFVIVAALIWLIWWWISSSRSEDKEEEGL